MEKKKSGKVDKKKKSKVAKKKKKVTKSKDMEFSSDDSDISNQNEADIDEWNPFTKNTKSAATPTNVEPVMDLFSGLINDEPSIDSLPQDITNINEDAFTDFTSVPSSLCENSIIESLATDHVFGMPTHIMDHKQTQILSTDQVQNSPIDPIKTVGKVSTLIQPKTSKMVKKFKNSKDKKTKTNDAAWDNDLIDLNLNKKPVKKKIIKKNDRNSMRNASLGQFRNPMQMQAAPGTSMMGGYPQMMSYSNTPMGCYSQPMGYPQMPGFPTGSYVPHIGSQRPQKKQSTQPKNPFF